MNFCFLWILEIAAILLMGTVCFFTLEFPCLSPSGRFAIQFEIYICMTLFFTLLFLYANKEVSTSTVILGQSIGLVHSLLTLGTCAIWIPFSLVFYLFIYIFYFLALSPLPQHKREDEIYPVHSI